MTDFTHGSSYWDGERETCPVFYDPEPDCYCMDLTSQSIPKAIQFCLKDFRQCPIYKRWEVTHHI